MVDVPAIANVVPQLRAPESRVSPGQIAAPYQELAANLTKMGEVVDKDVAQPLAIRAGEAAVSPDGKTVNQPGIPIVGAASAEFARAARFTALGRMTPEIENRMAEIRLEHANDPKGFQIAADAFKNSYINGDADKGIAPINDPALKGPVEKTILHAAGGAYRSVLEQTNQTNITNAKTTITSQISDLSNRMAQAAFTGGADSPEYKVMQGNLGALYQELGNDPRMGYPKARIESEVSEMVSQHKTMAIAGQAVRMMDSESPTARADAKKWLIDKVYNDKDLNLSLAQRHQAVTTAMGLMEARSGENKALIAANSSTVTTLLSQLHANTPYNPITVNDAIDNSRKIGDAESFYKLTFAKGMHDWDQTVRSLPLPQQMAALDSLDKLRTPFETGLVGSESSGNPRKVNQLGYAGLYQFGAARLADLGIYTPGEKENLKDWSKSPATAEGKWTGTFNIPGHPEVKTIADFLANPDAQRAAFGAHQGRMDQEITRLGLDKYEGQTVGGAAISRNALYGMIHLGGAQGTAEALASGGANAARDANGTSVMDYAKKFGGSGGAGAAWFNEARIEQVGRFRDYLKTQATDYVTTAEKMLNATGDLSDGMLSNINAVLKETGQDDLRKRMDVALMAHYGVKELNSLPTSVRQAWVTQSAPQAKDSPIAFQVHEHMAATIAANAKAMQDTPYSTYAVRTNAKPPPAYNFDDPANVAAVATVRAGQQKAIRANDGTGPASVFEGKEGEAFANTLTNGDPAKAAQALAGLAALPDDIYQATLAQKPVANALTGMMGSKEPNRMTAAMSAADKLWRANPADASEALGPAAITKLQAWQGLKGSFGSAELAERLNASDDPSTLKAREVAKEEAEKETKPLKADDIAYKLGTSWGIPLVSRVTNLVTGATPAAPFDSIKGGELVADYNATYTALRTYGVDKDKASDLAVQRLGATWGISAAAGNQVMKNPPERSYPAIGGSHDWLKSDLNAWVTKRAGNEFSAGQRTLEAGFAGAGSIRNWNIEGMISDGQTQAEIASGKPPSYQVAIKKADGTLQIMGSRIAFDPSDHIAEHGSRLEQRRQAVDFLRPGSNAGMPQP